MGRLRVAGALALLVAALSGCVPVACPWTLGEALLQNSWQTSGACRR